MSYLDQIQQSIDYIEDHLTEPLCVHDLAARIGFSPYHYYRIFGAYVGMPVMEFVRRRRLAHAAASLTSDRRILDIALDFGFQTHAGFTKAFLKVYGLPPERYRLHASARIPERVELSRFLEYKLKGGIIVEPRLLERSSFTIAGYVLETTTEISPHIQSTWAYIYNEWFPRSGHEFAAGCADFERYDDRSLSESRAVAEIWIPVVKKP